MKLRCVIGVALMCAAAALGSTGALAYIPQQPTWQPCDTAFTTGVLSTDPSNAGTAILTCARDDRVAQNRCFMWCSVCESAPLRLGLSAHTRAAYCDAPPATGTWPSSNTIIDLTVEAIMNATRVQGLYWLDDPGGPETNASACLTHIIQYMPRRDLLRMFGAGAAGDVFAFMDFMSENIRYALKARTAFSYASNVPWSIFLDFVLPYTQLGEKIDLYWRSRPRLWELLAPVIQQTPGALENATAAAHAIANVLPEAALQGTVAIVTQQNGVATPAVNMMMGNTRVDYVPGDVIRWRSSTAPGLLSPQQVVHQGGSCTGTAIVLSAAFRAMGIPARVAGCGESTVGNPGIGNDHHWVEYYDASHPGPFPPSATAGGDDYDAAFWHTKEGTSFGNAGGPWDSPSAPMKGCLQSVKKNGSDPGSTNRMFSMFGAKWSSSNFFPQLWANNSWSRRWQFVGGENRCGAYCMAWGCGVNNSMFWTQEECWPMES